MIKDLFGTRKIARMELAEELMAWLNEQDLQVPVENSFRAVSAKQFKKKIYKYLMEVR